jgi:hypothetical protein
MRFWVREIAGWLLVGVSLYLFLEVYVLLQDNKYFQTAPIVLMAIFIFRGGIQLLRVALAARICVQAQEPRAETLPPAPARRRPFPARRG